MNDEKQPEPKSSLHLPVEDLYYPSESDEPIEVVDWGDSQMETPLTVSQVKQYLMVPPDELVEEIPEEEFWAPVVTEQDWYGEEEKAMLNRFRALKEAVECQLTDRQIFRVGRTEIDVYLLGRKTNGGWAGLKTKVVET